jgi:site-specific DNA-methyltransferase (adenine-specific)
MKSEVFNMDCIEGMKQYQDNHFDLAIVDPPYGIGAGKRVGTIYKAGKEKGGKGFSNTKKYESKKWDSEAPLQNYYDELFRVSKNQIIWGGNYFTSFLYESRGWIYWDKKIINHQIDNYSDGELAWTSFDCILRKFTYDWIGLGYCNSSEKGSRIHPTQKPAALYKWILNNYAKEGDKILDTHLGSGSSRIAAYDLAFEFIGFELDKDYFDASQKRFDQHISQLVLF